MNNTIVTRIVIRSRRRRVEKVLNFQDTEGVRVKEKVVDRGPVYFGNPILVLRILHVRIVQILQKTLDQQGID